MGTGHVFISHSATDAEWTASFAEALKQRGVSVWLGSEILGESWPDALEAGLRGSDVVVALLDSENTPKPNLWFEVGAALGMGKRVVTIVPKELEPGVFPSHVRFRRSLVRDTPEQTAENLSAALKAA